MGEIAAQVKWTILLGSPASSGGLVFVVVFLSGFFFFTSVPFKNLQIRVLPIVSIYYIVIDLTQKFLFLFQI